MNQRLLRGFTIDWTKIDGRSYLRQIPAIRGLEALEFTRPVTFFVGENGSGKSTVLEAIAVKAGFNPEGGGRNFVFSTRETHSGLYEAMRLQKGYRAWKDGFFLRAESMYNVASVVEEYADSGLGDKASFYGQYGGRSLHEQSHGESFLALAEHRFRAGGLYLLDEPEAALSPQRQLTLLMRLHTLVESGAQFLIASHSPILLGFPEAQILSFDGDKPHPVSYEETDSYQVTKLFLEHRQQLLERLFYQGEWGEDT